MSERHCKNHSKKQKPLCHQPEGQPEKFIQPGKKNVKIGKPKSVYAHAEKNRGRTEERLVKVYDNLKNIDTEWVGLKTLIVVKRKTKVKTKRTTETAYFISSLPPATNAKIFYEGIRSHWQIENGLHYVKDVTFREDRSRIRTGNSPQNKSLIIDIVVNYGSGG